MFFEFGSKYRLYLNRNLENGKEKFFIMEFIVKIVHLIIKAFPFLFLMFYRSSYQINFYILLLITIILLVSDLRNLFTLCKYLYDYLQYLNIKGKLQKELLLNLFRFKKNVSDEQKSQNCSICHDPLIISRKLPCNHSFHLLISNLN